MTARATSRSVPVVPPPRGRDGRAGFTLIELLLVMALLLTVVGFAAPALSRFFRGRELDSEVFRFLALTRYGQSRAVSEGIPVVLWMDPESRRYGLEAESTWVESDDLAREFEVSEDIEIEVDLLVDETARDAPEPMLSPLTASPSSQRPANLKDLFWIRFTPDGFLGLSSPQWIAFRQVREGEPSSTLWVAQSRNRLSYEIRTNQPPPRLLY